MATRSNLDQANNENRKKPGLKDEPDDLIESNDPEEGSEPLDPEGEIVEPIGSINPEAPDYSSEDTLIDPIESNDPADPKSPVNQIREPGSGERDNDPVEEEPAIRDPERQPGDNSKKIL